MSNADDKTREDPLGDLVPEPHREEAASASELSRRPAENGDDKYRTLVENLNEGIWAIDENAKTTFVNKLMADMLGYTVDEMLGKSLFDFMDEHGVELANRNIERRRQGIKEHHEFQFLKKDGKRIFTSLETSPVFDENGDYTGALAAVLDVTQQRELEKKLEESERKYRGLYESMKDGVVFTDMDGSILDTNQAFLDMLGYTAEEVRRLTYQDLTPEKWHGLEADIVENQVRATGFSRPYEKEYVKKGGTVFPVDARVWLIEDEQGNPVGMWGIMRDITERRQAEEALERANIELDGYAHTVSHDLRAPLANIVLANYTLQELLKGPQTDETKETIFDTAEIISRNSEQISTLIGDLLSLAEAGQKPREVSVVDVSDVVRAVLEERSREIKEKGILVRVDERLGEVTAHPTQMYQLFSNLIGNAINHNDSPEPVLQISYLGDIEAGMHRYLVRDNGSGIPPEDTDNIFIPFFKKGRSGDSGIGLATAETIVRVYDGEIRAYNDNGACFEFAVRDFAHSKPVPQDLYREP